MALINEITNSPKQRHTIHGSTKCTYSIFEEGGRKYLQLDTYGSANRENKDVVSQSMQFSPEAIKDFIKIIEKENKIN